MRSQCQSLFYLKSDPKDDFLTTKPFPHIPSAASTLILFYCKYNLGFPVFCYKPKLKLSQRIPNSLTSVWIYNLMNFLLSNFGVSSQKVQKTKVRRNKKMCLLLSLFFQDTLWKNRLFKYCFKDIAQKLDIFSKTCWRFSKRQVKALDSRIFDS